MDKTLDLSVPWTSRQGTNEIYRYLRPGTSSNWQGTELSSRLFIRLLVKQAALTVPYELLSIVKDGWPPVRSR